MQNSNDKGTQKAAEALANEELERVNRRLDVSKTFFAWAMAGYFLVTLIAIGTSVGSFLTMISKGLLVVLVFGCGGLLYSAYSYWGILQGGMMYKMRFLVLAVLIVICAGSLANSFGLLSNLPF
ncbi:MAG: hypothetical protein PHU93_02330 [Candidatus Gracilibacteria bacterium]|nr:hypothetical protein [Candidatus Gracilibacteria bacterium]